MDKKAGIFVFITFIGVFALLSGYIFFTNSNNLELKLQLHNESLRKHSANSTSLSQTLDMKQDSITLLINKLNKIDVCHKKDSLTILRKNAQIKKLLHQKDSLMKVHHHHTLVTTN
jgi:enterochelin esterase-like enzyme